MANSQFWRELAVSFRQLLDVCDKPLSIEWQSRKPAPVPGQRSAAAILGEGSTGRCYVRFSALAIKAGQEVAPGQPNKLESWLNVLATRSKPLKPKDAKKGTDRRLEDVVRLSAEECERISNQLGETDALSLKYFTIPDFLYFPAHLFDKQGPKQWARMRIMQACERLNVPAHRCPKFADLDLPRRYGMNYLVKESLSIQSFHPLYESEAEWRDRARRDLENLLDQNASQFRLWFKREIEAGNVKKIPRTRDTTPLDLRYEWAARWYCLGESYKAISTDEYKVDRVRKTIKAILRQAGLPGRK